MSVVLVYSSNNSGGDWWLSKDDWDALEAAGWNVHWYQSKDWADKTTPSQYSDDPAELLRKVEPRGPFFLGAWAKSCAKEFGTPAEGIEEFERVANQNASDEGCNCCGPPHEFSYVDADGTRHYSSVEVTDTRVVWS